MSFFVEAAGGERSGNGEVTLTEAAQRLSCHVETLRRRVRSGTLKARRGPHGVYLVRMSDLALVWVEPGRGRPPRIDDEEASWALLESLVFKFRQTRSEALRLMAETRPAPTGRPHISRLLHVQRLRLMGLPYREIAVIAGTSASHARRLAHRDLEAALRAELRREERRRAADRRKRAGAVIAGIEGRLWEAGYRGLTRSDLIAAWPRQISRRQYQVSPSDAAHLRAAGLSDDDIDAIRAVGIPVDAYQFLLTRRSSES